MREKEQKGVKVCQIDSNYDRSLFCHEKDIRRIPNSGNRLIDNRVAARVATHCCFAACEAPTMDFHELALIPTHPRAHCQPPPGRQRTSRTTGTSQAADHHTPATCTRLVCPRRFRSCKRRNPRKAWKREKSTRNSHDLLFDPIQRLRTTARVAPSRQSRGEGTHPALKCDKLRRNAINGILKKSSITQIQKYIAMQTLRSIRSPVIS